MSTTHSSGIPGEGGGTKRIQIQPPTPLATVMLVDAQKSYRVVKVHWNDEIITKNKNKRTWTSGHWPTRMKLSPSISSIGGGQRCGQTPRPARITLSTCQVLCASHRWKARAPVHRGLHYEVRYAYLTYINSWGGMCNSHFRKIRLHISRIPLSSTIAKCFAKYCGPAKLIPHKLTLVME